MFLRLFFCKLMEKRKLSPNNGLIPKDVPLELYLEMVPSSPADNVTTRVCFRVFVFMGDK